MHRLLCLGQLSLVDSSGQPVSNAAAQPRRLGLLALLGRSAPKAISRDRLIGWFWPEADEERGRRSLNQALYALRTELGSEEVLLGQRDVRLNLDLVSCDAADFEAAMESGQIEEAAALYRGAFIDGFHLNSAPEFQQWVDQERRTLAHRYSEALEKLASTAEERGEYSAAVGWWRKAASAEPASSRLAMRLMRALAYLGDQSGAIRHATIYETIQQQQLELPPDPAVMAYAEELKHSVVNPPRLAHRESQGGVAVASPPPAVITLPSSTPLAAPAISAPVPVPSEPLAPAPARLRRWHYLALSGISLLVGILGLVSYLTRPGTAAVDGGSPIVAVLPLENRTGDSTFSLVGAMVTDWVTQCLTETGLVRVMDTRTLLTTREDIPTLARRTGATYLITGNFYRYGDSLEFRTQITFAHNGRIATSIDPLRASSLEPTGALRMLEERVTGALAVLVDRRLNNYTATSSNPPTWAAYQEFLLGMRDFGTHKDYLANFAHFARAARLDTTYWQARLWAGSSLANARRYPEADSVFQTLVSRRDELAPYDRASLDYFYGGFVRGDWETSHSGAERMAELAPLAGHALWALGLTSRMTGRLEASLKAYSRINLDYGWGAEWAERVLGETARTYHMLGKHDDEIEMTRRMLERAPNDGWGQTLDAIALAADLRYNELSRRVETAMTLGDNPRTWEPYSAGDLLMQVGRELRAHGAPSDTVRRYAEAAVQWYAAPTSAGISDTVHLLGHARASYAAGHWAEAKGLYERLVAANPGSPEFVAGAGAAAARLGDTARAEAALQRLSELDLPYPFGRRSRFSASVAAALGRRDDAIRFLAQSRREGLARWYDWHCLPDFVAYQNYPPFRELLRPRT